MSLVARAKKCALLKSWIVNLLGLARRCRLAHLDMRYLMNSSGGVATNNSGLSSIFISLATILDLYFGCNSSPLLMSTHLSLMGARPVA